MSIGANIGVGSLRIGIRMGNPDTSMASVARDATSLKYVPASAAQWAAAVAVAGLPGSPVSSWGFQESSGNIADAIGSATLTAAGLPAYQQAVAGWTRKAVTWVDGQNTKYGTTSNVPNFNASSGALLGYIYTSNTPAVERQVLMLGAATAFEARVTTAGKYRAYNQAGGVGTTFGAAYDSAVHPLLLVYNRGASTMALYSDTEYATTTYGAINGAGVFFGFQDASAPTGGVLFGALWTGTNAEFTVARARSLLSTLGWTIPW